MRSSLQSVADITHTQTLKHAHLMRLEIAVASVRDIGLHIIISRTQKSQRVGEVASWQISQVKSQ